MTEIILGMGEVGKTLFDLLSERKFDCVGIDVDKQKCKNYSKNSLKENSGMSSCLSSRRVGRFCRYRSRMD